MKKKNLNLQIGKYRSMESIRNRIDGIEGVNRKTLGIAAALIVGMVAIGFVSFAAGVGTGDKITQTHTSIVTVTQAGGAVTSTTTTYVQPELVVSTTYLNGTETTYNTWTTITWTNTTTSYDN